MVKGGNPGWMMADDQADHLRTMAEIAGEDGETPNLYQEALSKWQMESVDPAFDQQSLLAKDDDSDIMGWTDAQEENGAVDGIAVGGLLSAVISPEQLSYLVDMGAYAPGALAEGGSSRWQQDHDMGGGPAHFAELLAKEYLLNQFGTSFAMLDQEARMQLGAEMTMLLAMTTAPLIDRALYGPSVTQLDGANFGNNHGTKENIKGSQSSYSSPGNDAGLEGQTAEGGSAIQIPKAYDLKNSQTVQIKMNDFVKKAPYKGEVARPYIDSSGTNSLVGEIMNAGTPVKDSLLKNGWRWDVPGYFRGADGIWELVVDLDTNTIVHFNFVN